MERDSPLPQMSRISRDSLRILRDITRIRGLLGDVPLPDYYIHYGGGAFLLAFPVHCRAFWAVVFWGGFRGFLMETGRKLETGGSPQKVHWDAEPRVLTGIFMFPNSHARTAIHSHHFPRWPQNRKPNGFWEGEG